MKCLVTKLQGVVSDSTLKKLGEMRLSIEAQGGEFFQLRRSELVDGELYVETLDGSSNLATSLNGEYSSKISVGFASNTKIYLAEGKYDIRILDKNTISSITCDNPAKAITFDANDLAYLPKLISFAAYYPNELDLSLLESMPLIRDFRVWGRGVKGNLRGIVAVKNWNILGLDGTSIEGDVEELKDCEISHSLMLSSNLGLQGDIMSVAAKFTGLNTLNVASSPNLTGNISSISHLSNLASLAFSNTNVTGDVSVLGNFLSMDSCSPSQTLTGTIEEMVQTFRSNGKTSGTFTLKYVAAMQNVTFEEVALAEWLRANGGKSSFRVTWTESSILGESISA